MAPAGVIEQSAATAQTGQAAAQTGQSVQTDCDPSYPDVCLPSPPADLNCDDISECNFEVHSADPHGFDSNDDDGIGCENESNQSYDDQD